MFEKKNENKKPINPHKNIKKKKIYIRGIIWKHYNIQY